MATTLELTAYNTADTAVAGTSLNALANAAYAYGAEIDNSTALYLYGDIAITLSSAVTSVAPAYFSIFLIPNINGNYVASSGNPGTSYWQGNFVGAAGSITNLQIVGLRLTQKFKIVVQNNLGVALPATNTSTCQLYRYGQQSV